MKSISIAPNLSKGWETIRFRYVANTSKGKLPEKSEDELTAEDGVPYLSMEYLRGDAEPSDFVSARGMITAIENDILLLWDGSNAGEFLRAKTGAVSSTAALLTPTKFERGYLFWLCKGIEPVLKTFTNGMGIPHVDGEFLKDLRLPYPLDVNFQRIIASYLDRETARIDGLIAEKERMLALLEEKRTALISRVVTRGLDFNAPLKPSGQEWLGEIPAHWEEIRLGFLVTLQGGATPTTTKDEFWDGDIPWASPKDIKKPVLFDTIDHVSELALSGASISLIEPPALLLVVRGMILAKSVPTALMAVPMTINQDMKALKPSGIRIFAGYLKLVFDGLQEPLFMLIEESAHGTRCLRTDMLTSFKIPVPPVSEQHDIVRAVEIDQRKANALRDSLQLSITLAKERRASLITAAVTGQIPPGQMQI